MNRPPRMPPIWLALLLSFVGIIGMKLVYQSFTQGGFARGLLGGVLLVIGVTSVGTPLAFARLARQGFRITRK